MQKKSLGALRIVIALVLLACGVVGIVSSLSDMQETKETNVAQKQSVIDEMKTSYSNLQIGMSYEECVEVIGTDGELFSETDSAHFGKSAIYLWKPEGELFTGIECQFENDKLSSKTWVE